VSSLLSILSILSWSTGSVWASHPAERVLHAERRRQDLRHGQDWDGWQLADPVTAVAAAASPSRWARQTLL